MYIPPYKVSVNDQSIRIVYLLSIFDIILIFKVPKTKKNKKKNASLFKEKPYSKCKGSIQTLKKPLL